MTRSHREGDWLLHVSALQHAFPLFFCYNRTNYARWGSLYYKDCSKLPKTFPEIYEEFKKGSFVVNFKKTCGSAIPMDQALEKVYNKSAKSQGGIIGFTTLKEAVAQFNLIRHKKARISSLLRSICHLMIQDEYSLQRDSKNVKETAECISCYRRAHPSCRNTISLRCISLGTDICEELIVKPYVNKSKKLFDRLPRVKILVDKKQEQEKKVDLRKRNHEIL